MVLEGVKVSGWLGEIAYKDNEFRERVQFTTILERDRN